MPPHMPRLILVVENDPPLLQTLADTVTALGYDATLATTAADGMTLAEVAPPVAIILDTADAVAAVRADAPDAILLDVVLPDARETQGLGALRAAAGPSMPIVMVTANVDEDLGRELLKRGAFDYIMKPFDRNQLDRALTAA